MSDDEQFKDNIQNLMKEMAETKEKERQFMNSIQYKRNKKTERIKPDDLISQLPPPKSKQEIYQEMKQRQKASWKDPGHQNDEFSKVPVLKGTILTEWEIERIQLAERSYKVPQGKPGMKYLTHGTEFGESSRSIYPEKFQKHLQKTQEKFDDFRFSATKYGKIELDHKLDKIQQNNKEPFKLTNSVQSNAFGFDNHSTWECEISQKLRTQQITKNSKK
ncbi:hypothetical protein PPERSA_08851 [Pseudocohnilembus persalinus]|uniref:Uncharacterized protein n=1 Tax=Pseudocohnilembus persalinus TaxID=266149 RepID=A0A0V0R3S2_PSEPJ|nr:hypothetical protein PPERSA_08851 [Pseudocohnilembus persalinus]|eukprot:KRX09135.1 hypothetical protein PPERSA_08851 [Pseudocohnilembus persalinus]